MIQECIHTAFRSGTPCQLNMLRGVSAAFGAPEERKLPDAVKACLKVQNMKKTLDDDLVYEILSVVEEIPEGSVASYGQIARLVGRDRNARLVGKVLSMSACFGDYPCHRVVNHAGRLAPHFPEQRERLLAEGVTFQKNGCVDMKKHQWDC